MEFKLGNIVCKLGEKVSGFGILKDIVFLLL